jgi:hypothetical protein
MHPSDNHDNAIDELADDADLARIILGRDDKQFNRRVYLRALFAYLEGLSFFMRRGAEELLSKRRELGKVVNPETEFLLREEMPAIDKGGKVKYQKHRVPFADQFSFTLRTFIEGLEMKKDPFSEHGWCDLRKALTVRDRITHPKLQADVEISDDDLKICESGVNWFRSLAIEISKRENWGLGRQ